MDRFEYRLLAWPSNQTGDDTVAQLNAHGVEGWEAVGVAPRTAPVPMAGMGAQAVPEMVLVLKRRLVG